MEKDANKMHKILLMRLIASAALALLAITLLFGSIWGWFAMSNQTNIGGTELGTVENEENIGRIEVTVNDVPGDNITTPVDFLPGEFLVTKILVTNNTGTLRNYSLNLKRISITYPQSYDERIIRNGMYSYAGGAHFDDSTLTEETFKSFVSPLVNAMRYAVVTQDPAGAIPSSAVMKTYPLFTSLREGELKDVPFSAPSATELSGGSTYQLDSALQFTDVTLAPGESTELFLIMYYDETIGSSALLSLGASIDEVITLNNSNGFIGQRMQLLFQLVDRQTQNP